LIAVTSAPVLILAATPWLLTSHHRAVRHVRAWAIGATLLDDSGVVFQSNRADCGHTCLMITLRRFGRPVPASLVEAAREADIGLTVAELISLGTTVGLTPRFHRVPKACIRRSLGLVSLPAIVLVGPHYLLVDGPLLDGFITVIDPVLGRLRAPIELLERDWRQALITFTADSTPEAACPQNPFSQGGIS
jgi:ABC-type bacteriocin/lantibiotic exporter with double-glycine peptidase domain